jgi:hypothetical protein
VKDNSTSTNSAPKSDINDCDLCFIKNLQLQAGAPYFNGPDLASVYSSKTSSCGVKGYPLTTSTISLPSSVFFTPYMLLLLDLMTLVVARLVQQPPLLFRLALGLHTPLKVATLVKASPNLRV